MATVTTTITEHACDRCTDRIAKPRAPVGIDSNGPIAVEGAGPQTIRVAELCKACDDSLRLWWTRPARTAEKP